MFKTSKVFISDPWIIKECISDLPGPYASKAELLVIYKVNLSGEANISFSKGELQLFCNEYNLDYTKLVKGFFELLSLNYRINGHQIRPFINVVREEEKLKVTLDERLINHFYNPVEVSENEE